MNPGIVALAREIITEVERTALTLRRLSEGDVGEPTGEGKWTRKQILGHLIDSAANNHQRFVRAQLTNPFVWPGYEQVTWVRMHRYDRRPWSELVDLWVDLNRHVVSVIENVQEETLTTPCTIGEGEPVSLEWLMRDYLRHLRHHIGQLLSP